ncbi:MAG: cysteine desulfurase family protein [Candidatus Moranbacteria bacterium]|nr:cysteine desulfurase family protein [Candidatus Moranbacteria bacterium]
MKNIYLDHAATTPIDGQVANAMSPYLSHDFGNPSSVHSMGREAMSAVKSSRENIAGLLNSAPEEIIFTSGATEANNLVVFGLIRGLEKEKKGQKMHVITSTIEHPAILKCFQFLEAEGKVEVSYVPVNNKGIVESEVLKQNIQDNTVLISIMYVNNEAGSVQPIQQIGESVKNIKKTRAQQNNAFPLYFHTDAVQAANFFSCNVKELKVDMLSLSGHKIYGPKGMGVLFADKDVPLSPIQLGGGQENGRRAGTSNVPGIVGMSQALTLAAENKERNFKKIKENRDLLVNNIKQYIPDITFNGDLETTSPSHANITFHGVEGESVLLDLDFNGVAVSTGSACSSDNLRASHVLLAMGIAEEDAHGAIRFTLGKNNSEQEINKVTEILPGIIDRLRGIAPNIEQ